MRRILFTATIFLLIFSTTAGQNPEKKKYKATKISAAPAINGILDDEAWKSGEWVDDFTQYEPYNGNKPSQRTEFKILGKIDPDLIRYETTDDKEQEEVTE